MHKILKSSTLLLRPNRFSKLQLVGAGAVLAVFGVVVIFRIFASGAPLGSYPTTPPAAICGNASILNGPAAAPAGAVTVNPAVDLDLYNKTLNNPAGTIFYLLAGVHHLGGLPNGQIIPKNGNAYIGAPGAIIDGQNLNSYALVGQASGVKVQYLTVQNFVGVSQEGVVNHDAGSDWIVDHNTIQNNGGAGLFIGTNNVVSYNCLKDNKQYGFSLYKPAVQSDSAIKNVTLDHNEISGNNTADLEWNHDASGARTTLNNCGCTGGGKFWDVKGAAITNNYVHDNKSVGLWADTNNIDFLFEGNYIDHNEGEGIWYEISYNAVIRNNTLKRNAWVKGQTDQGSPGAAIYLSESGGDNRLSTTKTGTSTLEIYNNYLEDNFAGISAYENSNRFCDSKGNTSTAYCTPFVTPTFMTESPAGLPYNYFAPYNDTHPCYTQVANEPYRSNCRWNTQNISVHNNDLRFDPAKVPCAGTLCGVMALYGSGDDKITWSPYKTLEVQNNVMFNHSNRWSNNTYVGPWKFIVKYGGSDQIGWDRWQAPGPALPYTGSAIPDGFGQDVGSTCTGCLAVVAPPSGGSSGTPFDTDTATLEGSLGKWAPWFSSNVTRSIDKAQAGVASLRMDVTAPNGWGVQLSNYPGFSATPGNKTIGFWGLQGVGSLGATLTVSWRDAANADLQKDTIAIPALSTTWQQATKNITAPTGTTTVYLQITSTSGGSGNTGEYAYFDSFSVGDSTTADTTPPTNVTLTTPSTATGTVTLSSTASDTVGVAKLEFYNGTTLLGSSTTPSSGTATNGTWQYAWNTTTTTNGTYSLTSKAYDAANNTTVSAPVSVSVSNTTTSSGPTTPANFRTTGVTASQVSLAWDASTDPVAAITGYELKRKGPNDTAFVSIGTTGGTTVTDTTVTAGTTYGYIIESYSDGDGFKHSAPSAPLSVTIRAAATTLAPPTSLTASATSATSVALGWTASTSTTVTKYYIVRNGTTIAQTGNVTNYTDATASPSTTYSYTVLASDGTNTSTASNTASVTTPAPADTTAPSVPTSPSATVISYSQVDVSWTASTDTGGSGLRGYNLYRNGTKITASPTSTIPYGDGTVSPSATYTYTITAIDNAGNESAQSAVSNSVATPAAPITQTNLTGRVTGPSGAVLASATVYLNNGRTTITDGAGNYTLANVPNGTYSLTVSKKNFRTSTQTVDLTGGTKTVNVTLQRK